MSMNIRTDSICGHRRAAVLFSTFTLLSAFVLGGAECATVPGTTDPIPDPPDPARQEALKVRDQDHTVGDPNAPIVVIEYADFQCPFCGRFARETLPTIKAEYIDTGKVLWVFRHFPLRIHNCATAAARGSECANDQGMFFEFHDRLFQNQDNLCNEGLKEHAAAIGLDTGDFDACLESGEKADRVDEDTASGRTLEVTGTPAFVINGELVQGFKTVDQFRALLDN